MHGTVKIFKYLRENLLNLEFQASEVDAFLALSSEDKQSYLDNQFAKRRFLGDVKELADFIHDYLENNLLDYIDAEAGIFQYFVTPLTYGMNKVAVSLDNLVTYIETNDSLKASLDFDVDLFITHVEVLKSSTDYSIELASSLAQEKNLLVKSYPDYDLREEYVFQRAFLTDDVTKEAVLGYNIGDEIAKHLPDEQRVSEDLLKTIYDCIMELGLHRVGFFLQYASPDKPGFDFLDYLTENIVGLSFKKLSSKLSRDVAKKYIMDRKPILTKLGAALGQLGDKALPSLIYNLVDYELISTSNMINYVGDRSKIKKDKKLVKYILFLSNMQHYITKLNTYPKRMSNDKLMTDGDYHLTAYYKMFYSYWVYFHLKETPAYEQMAGRVDIGSMLGASILRGSSVVMYEVIPDNERTVDEMAGYFWTQVFTASQPYLLESYNLLMTALEETE